MSYTLKLKTDQPFNIKGEDSAEHKQDPENGAHKKAEPEYPGFCAGLCVFAVRLLRKVDIFKDIYTCYITISQMKKEDVT